MTRPLPVPLRVAFDVTPMIGARTGVGTLVAGFYEALRVRHDVQLKAYATTIRGRGKIVRSLNASLPPLPARFLRTAWLRADWPPVELWTRRIDMVHGMNYVVPPTRSHHSLASVHDLTVVRFPEMCTPDTLQYPSLLQRAFNRGAHVHVDSQFVADEVAEWSGLDTSRIHVVYPGLDALPASSLLVGSMSGDVLSSDVLTSDVLTSDVLTSDVLSGDALRHDALSDSARHGSTSPSDLESTDLSIGEFQVVSRLVGTRPFILALGTIEPRKDYPTLLRAFNEIAHADAELILVIAGTDGWGSDRFASAFATLPVDVRARVLRLGYVTPSVKEWLLRRARVLAYPSIYEGFGLPPLEAMQRHTPVVSTNAGSLPEVLGEAAVFVSVGDATALASQLLRVHLDTQFRSGLIEAGLARAQRYTWVGAAEEMFSTYQSVIERSGP